MTLVVTFMICILSAFAIVCPSAARDGIITTPMLHRDHLVQPPSNAPQLGDFGNIEDWLLKRLRSPSKTTTV